MQIKKEIGWLLKEKYNNKPSPNFYNDMARLEAGEPVDYVIGFTEFLGCKIDLSKKTLIPRPETEYWVGQIIKDTKMGNALDMFAGSGCIGLAVLKNNKNIKVDFADKDKKAVEQIKINFKINNVNGRVFQSDVFSNVREKYDYIFANPPYIPTARKNKIQQSVIRFEPKMALFGGRDGSFYVKKFLKDAKMHLNKGGEIFMEFGWGQKKNIERIIKGYNYNNFEFYRDQYNRWRWVVVS